MCVILPLILQNNTYIRIVNVFREQYRVKTDKSINYWHILKCIIRAWDSDKRAFNKQKLKTIKRPNTATTKHLMSCQKRFIPVSCEWDFIFNYWEMVFMCFWHYLFICTYHIEHRTSSRIVFIWLWILFYVLIIIIILLSCCVDEETENQQQNMLVPLKYEIVNTYCGNVFSQHINVTKTTNLTNLVLHDPISSHSRCTLPIWKMIWNYFETLKPNRNKTKPNTFSIC